jgi:large subunit ribosomal protein L4e
MSMAKIFDLEGKEVGSVELPELFSTKYRPETIKRAFLALQASRRQRYGANPLAGKRSSAHYHGKRHYRFTMMNREMARISRIHGKVGYLAFRARVVPQAVKGRKAHPPKAEKSFERKINKKENEAAIRSALAATANSSLVKKRGHLTAINELPVIVIDSLEKVKKTRDVNSFLEKIMKDEMKRCSSRKVRPGRGKMRGRRYKKKKGPLIIASGSCPLLKAARNIPGIDAASSEELDIELLAPGSQAGRLTIITKSALENLSKR